MRKGERAAAYPPGDRRETGCHRPMQAASVRARAPAPADEAVDGGRVHKADLARPAVAHDAHRRVWGRPARSRGRCGSGSSSGGRCRSGGSSGSCSRGSSSGGGAGRGRRPHDGRRWRSRRRRRRGQQGGRRQGSLRKRRDAARQGTSLPGQGRPWRGVRRAGRGQRRRGQRHERPQHGRRNGRRVGGGGSLQRRIGQRSSRSASAPNARHERAVQRRKLAGHARLAAADADAVAAAAVDAGTPAALGAPPRPRRLPAALVCRAARVGVWAAAHRSSWRGRLSLQLRRPGAALGGCQLSDALPRRSSRRARASRGRIRRGARRLPAEAARAAAASARRGRAFASALLPPGRQLLAGL